MPANWDPNDKGSYWVIGGRYSDMTFTHRDWCEVAGPYPTRYDAEAVWRKLSYIYSAEARVRFHIVRDVESLAA